MSLDQDGPAVGAQGGGRHSYAEVRASRASWRATSTWAAANKASLSVTSRLEESGPCSASLSRSAARQPGVGAVVGDDQALARAEEHGGHRPVALDLDLSARHGRAPGPTTLRTFGMVSVPKARAATPAGPLARNTS